MTNIEYTKQELLISVKDIGLTYGANEILRNISFDVHNIVRPGLTQGQVVSLIGRSGIGKTQLFRIIAGLTKPTVGEVRVGEKQEKVEAGKVGVVPQNYALFEHRTVFKNLEIALKHSEHKDMNILKDYIDKFDLNEHLRKFPAQLSGGQKQRVSIVQQLVAGNRYILMDEPFSGLDSIMIDKVLKTITKVTNDHEENTVIIISHDLENTLSVCDTAFVLAKAPGEPEKGAVLRAEYDLIELGLAWQEGVKDLPQFRGLVKEIKSII
jgi:ABC-type nitrate/sulfonate/bicarbonate transport system ATPase subunit